MKLDVETRRELAIHDAAKFFLAEIFDFGDGAIDGLDDFLETVDDGLGSIDGPAEVEDEAGAVSAADRGGGHGDGGFLLVRFWAAGRPWERRVSKLRVKSGMR